MKHTITFFALLALLVTTPARAFDLLGKNRTYYTESRYSLILGVGAGSQVSAQGVDDDGFDQAWRFGFSYSITRHFLMQAYYQFASIPMISPNPLAPGNLHSKFFYNSEVVRAVYRLDAGPIIPYGFAGIGFYQMTALNQQTGLGFPRGFVMPVGLGLETYFWRDRWSLALEYSYDLIFDENQSSAQLNLLRVNEVSFNLQTVLLQLAWHFF